MIFSYVSPALAAKAEEDLAKTDITQVGMNMYTTAYKWEVKSANGYTKEALTGFTDKLNYTIKNDEYLKKLYEFCDGCSRVVDPGFDDALLRYLSETPPDQTNANISYGILVAPFLHKKIREKITNGHTSAQESLIKQMIASISSQVKEQMDGFRDVSGMGLYYDGDLENSPYDLISDIKRIDEIFFSEIPEKGDYRNTSKEDVGALISGRVQSGSWASGENYTIDLATEVMEALGGKKKDGSAPSDSNNEIAGDCENGFCITIDFIKNTHYFLGGSMGGTSFQGILEEGVDWLTKNGDKRNFACNGPASIYFFQTNNSPNIKFRDIFSGAGVFVFWKTPKFLAGFLNRATVSSKDAEKSRSLQKKATEDALRLALKRRGIDYDHPTNLKLSRQRSIQDVTAKYNALDTNMTNLNNTLDKANKLYNQVLVEEGAGSERGYVKENTQDAIKHMEKMFDEVASRSRGFSQLTNDLNKILKFIKEKPNCKNNL